MYKMLIVVPFAALMLSGCVVAPSHSRAVIVAPALPIVVELGVEPYYYQSGYYYYYHNNYWRYSNSRSGPWTDLPRSHYPRETRFKGYSDNRGIYNDRDYDNRGRMNDRDNDVRGRANDRDNDNRGRANGRENDNRGGASGRDNDNRGGANGRDNDNRGRANGRDNDNRNQK